MTRLVVPMRGAIIFDRDGVLNRDVGYAYRPDQIIWTEGAHEAVKMVNDAGLFAFVATNQSGIARGLYAEADMHALHRWMNKELRSAGARIDAFAFSPYHPDAVVERYRRSASCRKPGPQMILDLLRQFDIERERAVMVGDAETDMEAATAAGISGVRFRGGNLAAVVAPLIGRI